MSIQLAWTDVANEDSYQVWRSERFPDAGAWSAIAALAANENSYIDTDVVSGRTYKYKIASVAGAAKTFGSSAEVYYSNRARDLLADETDGLSISFVDDNMSVKDSGGSDTETSILGGGVTRTGVQKIITGANGLLGYQLHNWTQLTNDCTEGVFWTGGANTTVGTNKNLDLDEGVEVTFSADWASFYQSYFSGTNGNFAIGQVLTYSIEVLSTGGVNEIQVRHSGIGSGSTDFDINPDGVTWTKCTVQGVCNKAEGSAMQVGPRIINGTSPVTYRIRRPSMQLGPIVDAGFIPNHQEGSSVTSPLPYYGLPFDHAVGSTTSAPLPLGVLNEPAATNLFKHSNFFEYNAGANDGWAGDPGNTRTPNSGISPSGENDAWELNTSTGTIQQIKSGGPIIGPYDGTITLWAKAGGSNPATHLRITTNNGIAWNTGLSVKHTLTSEWVRVELSGVLVSSGTDCAVILGSAFVEGGTDNDCLGTCLIWQAQLEAGLVATSPIVTGANEETRDPDQMNANAILPGWWITPAFLTGYCDFIITDGDQLANNCIIGVAFSHNLGGRVLNGTGANKYDLWAAPGNGWRLADEVDPGEYRNAIGCENGSNVGAGSSVNGAPGENFQAVPNVMTWAQLNIGYQTNTTTIFRGHIKELMVLPRQMDQADLNTLTTPDP